MTKIENNQSKGKVAQVIENVRYKEGTFRVKMQYSRKHPKYHKIQNFQTTLQVHYDKKEFLEKGTVVYIKNIKPVSRTKTWGIIEVISNGLGDNNVN